MAPPDVLTLPALGSLPPRIIYYVQPPVVPLYSPQYPTAQFGPQTQDPIRFPQVQPRQFMPMPALDGRQRLPPASTLIRLPPTLMDPMPILSCGMCNYTTYYRDTLAEHYISAHKPQGVMAHGLASSVAGPTTPPLMNDGNAAGSKKRPLSQMMDPTAHEIPVCQHSMPPQLPPMRIASSTVYPTPAGQASGMTALAEACAGTVLRTAKRTNTAVPPTPPESRDMASSAPATACPASSMASSPCSSATMPSPAKISGDESQLVAHQPSINVVKNLTMQDLVGNFESTSSNKTWHCTLCGRVCSSKSSLRRHIRRHKGLRPFHCNICPKAYTAKHNLDYHMRSAHPLASPSVIATRMKQRPDEIAPKQVSL